MSIFVENNTMINISTRILILKDFILIITFSFFFTATLKDNEPHLNVFLEPQLSFYPSIYSLNRFLPRDRHLFYEYNDETSKALSEKIVPHIMGFLT